MNTLKLYLILYQLCAALQSCAKDIVDKMIWYKMHDLVHALLMKEELFASDYATWLVALDAAEISGLMLTKTYDYEQLYEMFIQNARQANPVVFGLLPSMV